MSTSINFHRDIPIIIISYNRLHYLKQLIDYLDRNNYMNIIILDNNSTYRPLLDYLHTLKHKVVFLKKNYKHHVPWKCKEVRSIIKRQFYVVTDCDVIPDKCCPNDFIEYFYSILIRHPEKTKVGFSLRIDDLPSCFSQKDKVIEWEMQYWNNKIDVDLFDSKIDTTFALYRPNIFPNDSEWWDSIRTDKPYIACHLPWYEDTSNPSIEELFYRSTISLDVSDWTYSTDEKETNDLIKRILNEHRSLIVKYNNIYLNNIIIPKIWKKDNFFRLCRRIKRLTFRLFGVRR